MLGYLSLIALSTWKLMFTPLAGLAVGYSFWEIVFSCIIGAYISASIFFFGSSYFMKRSIRKKASKKAWAEANGLTYKAKRKFTKLNRRIIHIKQKLGKYFVYWALPLFLSIPIGAIVTAKFFKHHRIAFPMILFFLTVDCFLITFITFSLKGLAL